jgi:hypothetical protein
MGGKRGPRAKVKHGHRRRGRADPLYELWRDVRRRYPGQVCRRWQGSFESFAADLGPKPSRAHRLVRAREDRPWEPRNCGWSLSARTVRGEANPQAKLTAAQVDQIRGLVASGIPKTVVARCYSVSSSQVGRIVRRESWA